MYMENKKNKKISLKQLAKQIEATKNTLDRYNKLKEIHIECVFCKARPNMWTINRHLKSARCITNKNLMLSLPGNETVEANFLLYINNMRKEEQYDDDDNVNIEL